jgi:hypothetical protein
MTFLAPFAWSLLALGAPIIAFYLIKTRLRRKPVTTLLFWEQLRPPAYSHSLWRQLRRWLSLLLQLAFLALLVFALARPLARWETKGTQSIVLVLDPSPSMLATDVSPDRWSAALQSARRRVQGLRFSDQGALILAHSPPQVLSGWTGSRRTLEQAIAAARGACARENGRGDGIREALTLAHRLATGRAGGRIVLLSDGVWTDPPDAAQLAGVDWVRFGTDHPVNTAITSFAARRSLVAPGDYLLAAEVQHFGATAVDAELEIRRNGSLLDLQPLRLEPGQPWRKTWPGHADEAVSFQAQLRAFAGPTRQPAPDQLAADNSAGANLAAVVPVTVEIVGQPNGFLDAALNALPAVQWRRLNGIAALDLQKPAALTVFYRVDPPAGFAPGSALLLIDPPGGGFWGQPAGPIEHPLVSESERDSVPLRFVGLESVTLQAAREFHPPPWAEIFAQSFGQPLIFGHWPGGVDAGNVTRRWLVLPFDLEHTDFVLRTAFPILLGNLVQSLRAAAPVPAKPLPGAVKSLLTRTSVPALAAATATGGPAVESPWWAWAPLWWWAAFAGTAWLLGEWWLFSRRITE